MLEPTMREWAKRGTLCERDMITDIIGALEGVLDTIPGLTKEDRIEERKE